MMGRVVCIASLKGGVGKSTTAVNLSTGLAMAEKSTLLVDCDPQGHATAGMGIEKSALRRTLYHAVVGKARVSEVILDSELLFLKTLPADTGLFRADGEMRASAGAEHILGELLRDLKRRYDFIVVDLPPSLNLLTMNAMAAADFLLIPLQCEFYALESLGHLIEVIETLKGKGYPHLRIGGILLTMFDREDDHSRRIAEAVRNHFKDRVFRSVIPKDVRLRESSARGRPLLLRHITSAGARGYLNLTREVLEKVLPEGNRSGMLQDAIAFR